MISSLLDRRHFPILDSQRYLNQASLGLIGEPAVRAMHRFIDDVARHGNGRMSDEDEARFLDAMRAAASKLLSCPASRIAVVGCASEILAQIPLMIRIPQRGSVVAVKTDFPAVTRPWLREQGLGRARVRFVEDRPSESLTDALIGAIDSSTLVVTVSSVQYATGSTVDIGRLGKAVSGAGAHFIVDVTQELGARRVDASGWDADAVVCSGYKWLGGHGGVALAAMSPRLLEQVPPMTGWMGAPDPFDFDATRLAMADDARRYTQSTMSYASVACLAAAVGELMAIGGERIESRALALAGLLVERAAKRGWTPFRSPADGNGCAHIVALSHPESSAEEAMHELRRRGINCSSRGGRIRVSIAPYNDESDIDAFAQALQ
ncbi:MAG: aminotransferase class V-fold PLP-dependent enzyme [Steroidobacteraceae bacterium]